MCNLLVKDRKLLLFQGESYYSGLEDKNFSEELQHSILSLRLLSIVCVATYSHWAGWTRAEGDKNDLVFLQHQLVYGIRPFGFIRNIGANSLLTCSLCNWTDVNKTKKGMCLGGRWQWRSVMQYSWGGFSFAVVRTAGKAIHSHYFFQDPSELRMSLLSGAVEEQMHYYYGCWRCLLLAWVEIIWTAAVNDVQ